MLLSSLLIISIIGIFLTLIKTLVIILILFVIAFITVAIIVPLTRTVTVTKDSGSESGYSFGLGLGKTLKVYINFLYKCFFLLKIGPNVPTAHSFAPFILESSFSWKNIIKYITLPRIFTALSIIIFFYLLKNFITFDLFKLDFILLENIKVPLEIHKFLFIGILSILPRLFFLGFWEETFRLFSELYSNPKGLSQTTFHMEGGEDPNSQSQSQSSNEQPNSQRNEDKNENRQYRPRSEEEIKEMVHHKVTVSILGEYIVKDTKEVISAMSKWADVLKKYNDTIPLDGKQLEGYQDTLIKLLQFQSNTYTQFVSNRMSWLHARTENMLPSNKEKILEFRRKIMEIQADYRSKISTVQNLDSNTKQVKQLYAILNEYRNKVSKELNQAENIGLQDIRNSDLIKEPEVKKTINVQYIEAKRRYVHEDEYLRKKIGEILNAKK
jgi:hypothetical protein